MEFQAQGVHRLVVFATALAMAALALAGLAVPSEAATYCVGTSITGCDQGNMGLQAALTAAQNSVEEDNVWIAAGTYTGNFSYTFVTNGAVHVRGLGSSPAATNLKMVDTNSFDRGLSIQAAAGSSVANLKLTAPMDTDSSSDIGLYLIGETNFDGLLVDGVEVDGPQAAYSTGVFCGNCTIKDSTISLPPSGSFGNVAVQQVGGPARIVGSSLSAWEGFTHGSPGETSEIIRSRIQAVVGAETQAGNINISDSLIKLNDELGAVGIKLWNPNDSGFAMGGNFNGVTIINGVDNSLRGSIGVLAKADTSTAHPESVQATLTNSVISGFSNYPYGQSLDLEASGSGTVSFSSDYSAYDNGETTLVGGNGGGLTYDPGQHHLVLSGDPGYANPGSGDYTPAIGSPLLDAGDPAAPASGAADLNGNPRACHGTSDGVIRRDIGAFERRTVVSGDPDDCTYPVTSIIAAPIKPTEDRTPSFTFATDKNPGTYLCSWDGGPTTECAYNTDAPDLGLGAHTLSVRTRDQWGNIDQSAESASYEVVETTVPTCATDPSLCPATDTTAPRVTGLKAPKKTKQAKVRVRFKSNEAGSTFRCRLNKGKWKPCKSPWKTPKLKKGKNTVSVQATDKARNRSKVAKRVVRRVAG